MMKTKLLFTLIIFTCVKLNSQAILISQVTAEVPSWHDAQSGNWFEVFNNSKDSINLQGWAAVDMENNIIIFDSPLIIPPFSFKIVANDASFSHIKTYYQYRKQGNKPSKFIIDSHDTFFFKDIKYHRHHITKVSKKGHFDSPFQKSAETEFPNEIFGTNEDLILNINNLSAGSYYASFITHGNLKETKKMLVLSN